MNNRIFPTELAIKMAKEGYSNCHIARVIGYSNARVGQILRKNGIRKYRQYIWECIKDAVFNLPNPPPPPKPLSQNVLAAMLCPLTPIFIPLRHSKCSEHELILNRLLNPYSRTP